eukprot:SAG31_NODE_17090_length_684_cov_0.685470_1_plen_146_part_10
MYAQVHSSSFLTVNLDSLPAMIAPTLEDIFTLRSGGTLGTWEGTSREVFDRLAAPLAAVHTSTSVAAVSRADDGKWTIIAAATAKDGSSSISRSGAPEVAHHGFDAVVFACPANAALRALVAGSRSSAVCRLERWLLSSVEYVEKY